MTPSTIYDAYYTSTNVYYVGGMLGISDSSLSKTYSYNMGFIMSEDYS